MAHVTIPHSAKVVVRRRLTELSSAKLFFRTQQTASSHKRRAHYLALFVFHILIAHAVKEGERGAVSSFIKSGPRFRYLWQVINVERPGISAYVTCGRDGTIRFWHKGTFAHLRSIDHLDTIKTACGALIHVCCHARLVSWQPSQSRKSRHNIS